jgi:hypothetical protein
VIGQRPRAAALVPRRRRVVGLVPRPLRAAGVVPQRLRSAAFGPQQVRVAAIVHGTIEEVCDRVARLPAGVTSYVVETGAGLLVTLERERRWPMPSRRGVIRALQRDLAAIRHAG